MRVLGAWRALKTTALSSDGVSVVAPFGGEHAVGSITFEPNGWMTTVLCDGRRTDALDGHRQFHAYAGVYEFDGEGLVVNIEVATDPAMIGSRQSRAVRFDHEMMVLTPPPRSLDGRTITYEVYWQRVTEKSL